MQVEANEGGMSVEKLAALLNNDPGNDPKTEPANGPPVEAEVENPEDTSEQSDDVPAENDDEIELVKADDDDGDAPKGKKPSGSQRLRIQLERARAELEALRAQSVPQRPDARPEDVLSDAIRQRIGPPPKEADYPGDYLAYERAATAYQVSEMMLRPQLVQEAQRAEQVRREAIQERVADFREAVDGLAAKLPDIKESLRRFGEANPPDSLSELILDDEAKGPLVAYYLSKNPQKMADLARMSARAQAVEYGRLSASISLPKPKAATKASPPLAPVKGTGAKPSRSLDDLPMDEFAQRLIRDMRKDG